MSAKTDFVEQIAKLIQKWSPKYNIKVNSPIIAQAILESGWGQSELAKNAHNYFGLKYRAGRCPTAAGTYIKVGSEQNKDGSYTSSTMTWCKFNTMEDGVRGYFDFINNSNYANLKNIDNPRKYLENIKADGYATSLNYVSNLMKVINDNNLTKYDTTEVKTVGYTNSSLVNYTKLSPNHSGTRTHSIDRITVHCFVGQVTVERIGEVFAPVKRQASCNYGIAKDGKVALICEEKNRSWCTSSNANDQRAITIECASESYSPYKFNDVVYNKLIDLCTDICKRNGKKKLLWISNKTKALAYSPKSDEMLLTVHMWFANKSCPGPWMLEREGDLASKVTARLAGTTNDNSTPKTDNRSSDTSATISYPKAPFNVKVLISDLNLRTAPSMSGAVIGHAPKGAGVITKRTGDWGYLQSKGAWIYLPNKEYVTIGSAVAAVKDKTYKVKVTVSALNVRAGAGVNYKVNTVIRDKGVYTIVEEKNGWGKLKSGAGWISLYYTKKV